MPVAGNIGSSSIGLSRMIQARLRDGTQALKNPESLSACVLGQLQLLRAMLEFPRVAGKCRAVVPKVRQHARSFSRASGRPILGQER
jgi:hypothetical protein